MVLSIRPLRYILEVHSHWLDRMCLELISLCGSRRLEIRPWEHGIRLFFFYPAFSALHAFRRAKHDDDGDDDDGDDHGDGDGDGDGAVAKVHEGFPGNP